MPGDPDIRYLRNSVKAVVDAYNGSVVLYVSEPGDPILASWRRLFPSLFQPLWRMPAPLQAHIRYPLRQFELQTAQLLRYHVTDPRVFYSGDDVWQVPMELYGTSQVPVKPYHISAQVAGRQNPEFLLLAAAHPPGPPQPGGLARARSDAPHYGELLLLRFPSQTPIFGPEQMQALINQNPRISQHFGLWDRAGSEVIQGNLLVMPDRAKPCSMWSRCTSRPATGACPTLTRVVVSDGTRIAMEDSLEKGIEALLRSAPLPPGGLQPIRRTRSSPDPSNTLSPMAAGTRGERRRLSEGAEWRRRRRFSGDPAVEIGDLRRFTRSWSTSTPAPWRICSGRPACGGWRRAMC